MANYDHYSQTQSHQSQVNLHPIKTVEACLDQMCSQLAFLDFACLQIFQMQWLKVRLVLSGIKFLSYWHLLRHDSTDTCLISLKLEVDYYNCTTDIYNLLKYAPIDPSLMKLMFEMGYFSPQTLTAFLWNIEIFDWKNKVTYRFRRFW